MLLLSLTQAVALLNCGLPPSMAAPGASVDATNNSSALQIVTGRESPGKSLSGGKILPTELDRKSSIGIICSSKGSEKKESSHVGTAGKKSAIKQDDPLWYKDAVIYEIHVKDFFDSDANGYGDFRGLLSKLDYVEKLGANCIWLLPFYPSPLKDDGYDVAEYRSVHKLYGNMDDFRKFVTEAHSRGIRVITDFVLNHTSDQHPWFQAARKAAPGSPERDYYVWSDTDQKYKDTRIIFTDTEKSNWTYDPVAKAYFWHRFFSHQPDLNYDNPELVKAMVDNLSFWFDLGIDGVRLDAAPYLIEREGTNCENLPETHKVLKDMRVMLDKSHPNCIMLAESNQWAPDLLKYFGNGDECKMAYNFPVMPRLYMAISQENRQPIIDKLHDTASIPDNCQWAVFLRNHDELTLEMVTPEEREFMYKTYAPEPRMKLNLGIRRRLAPLMNFDRAKIELMNNLIFTLPGTPIIYYGDEIGMGDNIQLNDRDGVRTPMQWSNSTNGGFSTAPADKLYNQPLADVPGGYKTVNVEAALKDPSSLLNWTKKAIAIRNKHQVFGRGTIDFLQPEDHAIMAFLRQYKGETVLSVSNLSKTARSVDLDLATYAGAKPVDLFGKKTFAEISKKPYKLELAPHGYYWLQLKARAK
jgi:maltose alpha-D-glucosyltransferase / alpha-amylase